jgi:hypothetical protein
MPKDKRLARTLRHITVTCGAMTLLGAYTIAFAQEAPKRCAATITSSHFVFGR